MSQTTFTGSVLPILRDQVDTDIIVRIERLATLARGQFGPWAFESLRYDAAGQPNPHFPMNWACCAKARVLIAGANFGCGSSRENAVWAIQESGLQAVVAPSFGDIFFANCKANRLLAVELAAADYEQIRGILAERLTAEGHCPVEATLDLGGHLLVLSQGNQELLRVGVRVEDGMRQAILNPVDPIDLTLADRDQIETFAKTLHSQNPWLRPPSPKAFGL
ncbi:MAG: 3-isopropylmalate dehydratase small subunit [Betaproteobacteria bacterium]|nr:3-isopropylmalate dehydratase small subunit [Betaproteobacteria bacterium]